MVHLYLGDIIPKLKASQPGKRMPFFSSLNRSFGWRILSEDFKKYEKGIRSEIYDINEIQKENYLTAMAVSDHTGVTVIGSGCKEGNLYFVKDISAIKDIGTGPRFKFIHKEAVGAPIHSLDWSGEHLLVGTNQGTSKIYNVDIEQDTLNEMTCIGQYTHLPLEHHASHNMMNSHIKSAEFAPNYSSKDTTENISHRFLSVVMNSVSIWDVAQDTSPVKQYQPSESALSFASWSPNDPLSLVVCGGYDKRLNIIDTRLPSSEHQGVVWSVDHAHDRPIRDAKFNPYIPYWLASGGEDSMVNIWDIRSNYRGPVAKIDGILGMVTSVTWSNIRPENIGTTSSEGIMQFWYLSPESFPIWDSHYKIAPFSSQDTLPITRAFEEDNIWCIKGGRFRDKEKSWVTEGDSQALDELHMQSTKLLAGALALGAWGKPELGAIYKGEENIHSKGQVITLKPAKLRPSMYYSITEGGQLVSHTIRFDAMSNLRDRHRYDPKDKNELAALIEDDIYCRRILEANRKLDMLKATKGSDALDEEHRLEDVKFLEDCLKIRPSIKEGDWKFNSVPDKTNRRISRRLWNDEDEWDMAIQTFKSDCKYWSYRIPPGFDEKYKFPLNITEPIIAPHLLEVQPVQHDLPPFMDRSPMLLFSTSPAGEPVQMFTEEPDTYSDTMEDKPVLTINHPSSESLNKSALGIRRSSRSPPVITVNDAANKANELENVPHAIDTDMHHTNPFEHCIASAPVVSKNPFEASLIEYTMAPSSAKANSIQSLEHEQEILDTLPLEKQDTTHTQTSKESKKSKKRSSWIHTGQRLSLTLSRKKSVPEFEDEPKTPHSTKKHRFNPFKKMLARHEAEEAEQRENPFDPINTMQRSDSGNRRNALHGPF